MELPSGKATLKADMLHTDPSQHSKIKYIINSAFTWRSSTEKKKKKKPTSYRRNIWNLLHFAGPECGLLCCWWWGLGVFYCKNETTFSFRGSSYFLLSEVSFRQHFLTQFRNILSWCWRVTIGVSEIISFTPLPALFVKTQCRFNLYQLTKVV